MKNVDKCKNKDILTVHTNGGLKYVFCTTSIHILSIRAHYNPDYISTILEFKDIKNINGSRITTDT